MRGEPTQRISKKALPVWRIKAGIDSAIFALFPIGYGIAISFFSFPFWILWVLIAMVFTYSVVSIFIMPILRWKRWRFDVLEDEIDLQHGVFVVKRTLVPMIRVQHVDTEHGPILRKYGLATVTISTAATVHRIPALPFEQADELRDSISKLATVADEDD
ncbi:PH domain-containing protein [Alkalihalobacillus sp. LMS39]|uniref:PH domain-containing protein n=1 Tax=Alkalihalobacillus sp. LMS39 TaxID=2924032 RepID=UPI001FB37242|nr:PH domain-containing protein [Alkalihalobacillus sp. LMS39]UOE92276.1 PH domain-containing protein [Alkalihalobacillus sp. LMS39]